MEVGVLDPSPRPAHPDGGRLHIHVGPAVPGDAHAAVRRLDAADQVGAAARRRRLRVPGLHSASPLLLRHAACCRAVSADPGRAGPARGHRQHHQPHVPHPVLPGAARLHLLVPRGRAGDIVRLVAWRRVRGDGEGPGHHQLPAGAGRRARRLRQVLLQPIQRRGGVSARARAKRRAAGGHADGLGGAVQQLALHRGAAAAGRSTRPPAARAARQLIAHSHTLSRDSLPMLQTSMLYTNF